MAKIKRYLYQQGGDNDQCYTPEALELDTQIQKVLAPILDKYVGYGYGVREIAHIMHGAIADLEVTSVAGWRKMPEITKIEGAF